MNRKVLIGVLVSLMLAVFATGAGAVAINPDLDCLDWVSVDGVIVCYLGNVDNLDGTTTWTYAATPDVDYGNALSHISFTMCVEDIVSPLHGDTYLTVHDYGAIDGRDDIPYNVELGTDPTLPGDVTGIKYEPLDSQPQLTDGDIDIYQFTQLTQANQGTRLNPVGVKGGQSGEVDMLEGPICDGTTAVNLVDFSASSGLFARMLAFFGLR